MSWTEASRTGDRESEQGRATGESGQRPGQQGDGDDQRQGQQNWTRTGGAGREDRHRRRGELARGRLAAVEQIQHGIAVVAHQHQGSLRQPAAQLHDHLAGPVGELLVLASLQDAAGESQTALGPMANTGECPKSLRWGHAEALSESRGAFPPPEQGLRLETSRTLALANTAQRHTVAGRLEFCQALPNTRRRVSVLFLVALAFRPLGSLMLLMFSTSAVRI